MLEFLVNNLPSINNQLLPTVVAMLRTTFYRLIFLFTNTLNYST